MVRTSYNKCGCDNDQSCDLYHMLQCAHLIRITQIKTNESVVGHLNQCRMSSQVWNDVKLCWNVQPNFCLCAGIGCPVPRIPAEASPLADHVSATRILCGALVFPTIATIVGKLMFSSVNSNLQRTILVRMVQHFDSWGQSGKLLSQTHIREHYSAETAYYGLHIRPQQWGSHKGCGVRSYLPTAKPHKCQTGFRVPPAGLHANYLRH